MSVRVGAVLFLIGAAAVSFGCGDGGRELSLDDYYADLSRVQAEAQQRTPSSDVDPGNIPADTPPAELRRLLKQGLTATRELNDAFLDDLEAIDPPPEAEDAHSEFVAAAAAVSVWIDDMIAAAEDVDTLAEFDAMVQASSYRDVEQAFIESCTGLERIATDNHIEVNLDCTH